MAYDAARDLYRRALVLASQGRPREALEAFAQTLALEPDFPEALDGRADVLRMLGRCEDALADCDRSIALMPGRAPAHANRGIVLIVMGRLGEAQAALDRALALDPRFVRALNARAGLYRQSGRMPEALADLDLSLAVRPAQITALSNKANLLLELGRPEDALAAAERALAIDADHVPSLCNRGTALLVAYRFDEAEAAFRKALALDPSLGQAASQCFHIASLKCDWTGHGEALADLAARIRKGQRLYPWQVVVALDDPLLQLEAAKRHAAAPAAPRPYAKTHDRLRIAYLSPDFREHATGYQTVELFECHDRSRFETFGVCLWPSAKQSAVRDRLKAAFDHFLEAGKLGDAELAGTLAEAEIDIVVDLAGYVAMGRTNALALRPAPVAVNYYGYPGTLGAGFVDYIIADPYLVPEGAERYYAERVVRLPRSYYPADTKRAAAATPSRAEAGLPEQGFVFCSFNKAYKFTPELFDIWMRLLRQVEGSVLWLLADLRSARDNLAKEAEARGVGRERLVFADRLAHGEHSARIALADLFLDTLPCNAHTTASDVLWAGVPVLTAAGKSFAARVAGSQLAALGLHELIASDLKAYESLALELATSPARLGSLRGKLARGRAGLFDTPKLCRELERAYRTMWDIRESGSVPQGFDVPPGGPDPR